MTTLPSDMFVTRKETANYLCWESEDSVDAHLTKSETFVPGKMRYRLLQDGGRRRRVRVLRSDVLAMLKPFEEAA